MKRRAAVWAFVVVVAAIPAQSLSYQVSPKNVEEADQETFSYWDGNQDGNLSYQEYYYYATDQGMSAPQAENMFGNLDGDNSGGLSFGEFTAGTCCT